MADPIPPEPSKPALDPDAESNPLDEAAVKVDDPGESHRKGYAADAKPPQPPKGIKPYPLEGEQS